MAIVGSAYVNIRAITDTLKADIEKAFAGISDISVRVHADTEVARREIEDVGNDSPDIHADVHADTAGATAEITGWRASMARLVGNIRANVHVENLMAESARLALLARDRVVNIKVKVEKSALNVLGNALQRLSGFRMVKEIFEEGILKKAKIDEVVASVGKMGLMFTAIGGPILSATQGILTLGASLVNVAGAGAALGPAFMTAFGVQMYILTSALKDAKKVIPDVVNEYKQLHQEISDNFWKTAIGGSRDFLVQTLPALRAGMNQTAQEMGRTVSVIADTLKNGFAQGRLDLLFNNLNASIINARPGFMWFADALLALGRVGSTYLPAFGTWISDIAGRFDNFIKTAEGTGQLKSFIDSGISAFKDLGHIIGDVFGILGSLTDAARMAGSDGLGTLLKVMDQLDAIASQPVFKGQLAEIFSGASSAAADLAKGIGFVLQGIGSASGVIQNIFTTLGGVLNGLGASIGAVLSNPAFQQGMNDLVNGLGQGLNAIVPVIALLGPKLGEIASIAGLVASNIGVALGEALKAVIPLVTGLGEFLKPIVPILGTILVGAIKAISPLLAELGPIFAKLGPPIADLMDAIGGLLNDSLKDFIPILIPIVDILGGALFVAITAVSGVVRAFADVLKGDFSGALKALDDAGNKIVDFLNGVFGVDLRQMGKDFEKGWNDFWGGAWLSSGIDQANTNVNNDINNWLGGIGGMIGDWGNSIAAAWNGLWQGIADFFAPILQGISDTINTVVGFIVNTWNGYWNLLFTTYSTIWTNLLNFFQPVIDLISTIIIGAVQIISEIWNQAWNIIGLVFQGVWQNLVAFFTPIIQLISDTISNVVNFIVAIWNTSWQAVSDFFTGIWNGIIGFVTPIINQISDTITTAIAVVNVIWSTIWFNVQNTFNQIWMNIMNFITPIIANIANWIISTVSNISNWWNGAWSNISGFFTGIWNTIVNGASNLVNGIRDFIGQAVDFVRGIPGRVGDAIGNLGNTLYNAGKDLINGLNRGIQDTINNVLEGIRNMGGQIERAVKDFFGIKSPSRMFRFQVGQQLGAGLVLGLQDSIAPVTQAALDLASAAVPAVGAASFNYTASGFAAQAAAASSNGTIVGAGTDGSGAIVFQNPVFNQTDYADANSMGRELYKNIKMAGGTTL